MEALEGRFNVRDRVRVRVGGLGGPIQGQGYIIRVRVGGLGHQT